MVGKGRSRKGGADVAVVPRAMTHRIRIWLAACAGAFLGAVVASFRTIDPEASSSRSQTGDLSPTTEVSNLRPDRADAALNYLAGLRGPTGEARMKGFDLLRSELIEWLEQDPEGCVEFATRNGCAGLLDSDAIDTAVQQVLTTDSINVFAKAPGMVNPIVRDAWWRSAYHHLAARDSAAAFDTLQQTPAMLVDEFASYLAKDWGQRDGKTAADAFLNYSASRYREYHLGEVFQGWAARESAAAAKHLLGLWESGSVSAATLDQFFDTPHPNIDGVAATLVKHLSSNPHDSIVGRHLVMITRNWAEQNPDSALQWAYSQPQTWAGFRAIEDVAAGLCEAGKASRALDLAERLPSDYSRRRIYDDAAMSLVRDGPPKKAIDWAENIASPMLRQVAMRTALNMWMNEDTEAALESCLSYDKANTWSPVLIEGIRNRLRPSDSAAWTWTLDPDQISRIKTFADETSSNENLALRAIIQEYEKSKNR